jgi:hypothetical protein
MTPDPTASRLDRALQWDADIDQRGNPPPPAETLYYAIGRQGQRVGVALSGQWELWECWGQRWELHTATKQAYQVPE